MTRSNAQFCNWLVSRGHLSADAADRLLNETDSGHSIAERIVAENLLPPEHLQQALHRFAEETTIIDDVPPSADREPAPDTFEVLKKLGQGAMGAVYLARDGRAQGRKVAVKVIRPGRADPEAIERFFREGRAVAAVSHPNVIRIHRLERDGNAGRLIMEFVDGSSLNDRIEEGPLDEREAAEIMACVCEGLSAAHDAGILHRDVKPQNILLERGSNRPVVTDFGLARLREAATLTNTGDILGTPVYMSPEQARGEAVDERADVYACGATLYKLVTGLAPYQDRSSVVRILHDLCRGRPPAPPSGLQPDLDPGLENIILRAMARNPDRRHPSTEALARDLRAHLAGEAIAPAPRSTTPLLAGLGALLLGAGLILLYLPTGQPTPSESEAEKTAEVPAPDPEKQDDDETLEPAPPPHLPRWRAHFLELPEPNEIQEAVQAASGLQLGHMGQMAEEVPIFATIRRCRILARVEPTTAARALTAYLLLPNDMAVKVGERTYDAEEDTLRLFYREWLMDEVTAGLIENVDHPTVEKRITRLQEEQLDLKKRERSYRERRLSRLFWVLAHEGKGWPSLKWSLALRDTTTEELTFSMAAVLTHPAPSDEVRTLIDNVQKAATGRAEQNNYDAHDFRESRRYYQGPYFEAIRDLHTWLTDDGPFPLKGYRALKPEDQRVFSQVIVRHLLGRKRAETHLGLGSPELAELADEIAFQEIDPEAQYQALNRVAQTGLIQVLVRNLLETADPEIRTFLERLNRHLTLDKHLGSEISGPLKAYIEEATNWARTATRRKKKQDEPGSGRTEPPRTD